jgi:hypothetical protein
MSDRRISSHLPKKFKVQNPNGKIMPKSQAQSSNETPKSPKEKSDLCFISFI